eukprot:COSAG06_NODE_1903_length_8098_cov_13.582286_5_plen_55_part_00
MRTDRSCSYLDVIHIAIVCNASERTIKLTGKSSHEPGSATRQAGRDLRRNSCKC